MFAEQPGAARISGFCRSKEHSLQPGSLLTTRRQRGWREWFSTDSQEGFEYRSPVAVNPRPNLNLNAPTGGAEGLCSASIEAIVPAQAEMINSGVYQPTFAWKDPLQNRLPQKRSPMSN
jgi:hypothetical protein